MLNIDPDKRAKVLAALELKAKAFGVKIDYVIDHEHHREFLICDGDTKICTTYNSIDGVEREFIGYIFLYGWGRPISKRTQTDIRQFWFDKDFKQPWNK